uniref:Fucosyltransferase n=1 Tax=Heliothis virescens TaxID=7102 RepID=A0A2A4J121_HELVI
MRSIKIFFLVSCTSFTFSLLWVQLATRADQPAVTETLIQEAIENVGQDFRYINVYRKPTAVPEDFKYILLWTSKDIYPFNYFRGGQKAFLDGNCSMVKCYVTSDRKFFGGDLTKFDVIAFNGRKMRTSDLPHSRSYHQRYMYVNLESADNFPVCAEQYDSFFNWTMTYRLDSDIPYPYLMVRDSKGEIVGPSRKMRWKENMESVDDEYAGRITNKTKAAAWIVSNCYTKSGRNGYMIALAKALKHYGLTVDVYGKCGTMKCPREGLGNCKSLLRNDYFFYLSLENSLSEDYVTEKVLTAFESDVVPIVYSGADYSRFLPPGSYIDGRKQPVVELAAKIYKLMHSPKEYLRYFRWKPHYTYNKSFAIKKAACHLPFLRLMRSIKFFCLVSCTSFAFSLLWVQLATRPDQPAVTETLIQEAIENIRQDFRSYLPEALPKDFKYILLWTRNDYAPFYYFRDGQKAFLDNNCSSQPITSLCVRSSTTHSSIGR